MKQILTLTLCDPCSKREGETVEAESLDFIGLDGKRYTIDLCENHRENAPISWLYNEGVQWAVEVSESIRKVRKVREVGVTNNARTCHLCGEKAGLNSEQKMNHIRKEHPDTPFKCTQGCDNVYDSSQALSLHERRTHGNLTGNPAGLRSA